MHRSEAEDLCRCVECGAEISVERDRGYPITDEDALCYACAERRGGQYDETEDRWASPPDLSGLPAATWPAPESRI